jgi:hypothetical protein
MHREVGNRHFTGKNERHNSRFQCKPNLAMLSIVTLWLREIGTCQRARIANFCFHMSAIGIVRPCSCPTSNKMLAKRAFLKFVDLERSRGISFFQCSAPRKFITALVLAGKAASPVLPGCRAFQPIETQAPSKMRRRRSSTKAL